MKSSEICKYALIGCPIKRCPKAHSVEEFTPKRCVCKKNCDNLHPHQSKATLFRRFPFVEPLPAVSSPLPAFECPYGTDCPKIYCPYDSAKYPVDWTDESPPDFDQPLVWRPF
jgi:hypothetical protein